MTELTKEEMFIYKWQYRMLGDFQNALIGAIILADMSNLARLAEGFPIEVRAWQRFAYEKGWWDSVLTKISVIKETNNGFR